MMKQLINLRTKSFTIFCFIYFISPPVIFSEAEWTVLIIAQTKIMDKNKENNKYAEYNEFTQHLENIQTFAQELGKFNKKLNILIQWEKPEINTLQRYKITEKGLEFIQDLPQKDYPEKIVDFVKWGISTYPSKYIALILSGHGTGIIDPKIPPVKGILFELENRTYLNNQQLSKAMSQIKNKILGEKKLDIIGMNACLMAGIEVQYQIKDEAIIFIGSEEKENAPGWLLSKIFKELVLHSLTPVELANIIVDTYGSYYRYHKLPYFTLSAVNLENIDNLKNNLDEIITQIQDCQKVPYGDEIKKIIQDARKDCLQFSHPEYIDLGSFYSELQKNLREPLSHEPKIKDLKKKLRSGIKLIEKIVIAKTTGKEVSQAKGISIYYPKHPPNHQHLPNHPKRLFLHPSYLKTKFAKESKWLQFLKDNPVEDDQGKKWTLFNLSNWIWNWIWKGEKP